MSHYNYVIIGGGPAGYASAIRAAKQGVTSIAVIESTGVLGGVCLHRGCVPAKTMIAAAETVDHAAHMNSMATEPFAYVLDYTKIRERQRKIIDQSAKGLDAQFKKLGIALIHGTATFASPDAITVTAADGGVNSVTFDHALIAAGSKPARFFGVAEDRLLTSDTVFELETLPASMLIVGGGYIGCEFAGALARLGVNVTLMELENRILPMEDKEVAETLAREFRKNKIAIKTGVGVKKMSEGGEGVIAEFADGSTVTAEKVLLCIGQRFDTKPLTLDAAGIETGPKGEIVTDSRLATSNPHVFAAGDVAGNFQLAYTAYREGIFVADQIAGVESDALPNAVVPRVVFTIPEIGAVGITEEKAPEGAKIGRFPFRALARAHAAGEIVGFAKVIADGNSDQLLGVHLIGARATDLIHTATVALAAGMTATQFGDLLFAHPTFAESMGEAAEAVHGLNIHG